jgi:hypothetical protein
VVNWTNGPSCGGAGPLARIVSRARTVTVSGRVHLLILTKPAPGTPKNANCPAVAITTTTQIALPGGATPQYIYDDGSTNRVGQRISLG